jgi:hypothetical protein
VYLVCRGPQTVFAQAIGIPPEESRLESLSNEVLKDRLAAGRDVYVRSAANPAEASDDLWTWLVAACAVCLLGEIGALLAFRS